MASGDTMVWLFAADAEPPSSALATLDTRNARTVLDFDDTTPESVEFEWGLPSNYAGGGVTVDVYTMATSATSGDFMLGLSAERGNEANNDADLAAFGTESTATGTANATSGKKTKTTLVISHANLGSPAAGDPMRFKLRRVADDVADTMVGDLEFIEMHVKET